MFSFTLPENFSIFLDNLCMYHVCFDFLSFFMIIFTWWFCKYMGTFNPSQGLQPLEENDVLLNEEEEIKMSETSEKEDEEDLDILKWSENDNIVSNIKKMRQKVIVNELKSKLTEDELEREKQTEKMQLEKIFQLLRNQEDKFQMTSMEQLQDQLHLYRI